MINERYSIKKKLGEGRSKVFLCNDNENPSDDIAIKFLSVKADKAEIEIFHNEFITLRRLNHPGIVQGLNFGTIVKNSSPADNVAVGSKYFTLEYFSGKPLLEYEDFDEKSLKKFITQICSLLFYLHQSDYIYYDLKPENILVKKLNDEPAIKLIDLGFAQKGDSKKRSREHNGDGFIKGTAEYIAPELLKNEKHDNRVDLYSLGMILYRIVYKKFPFNSNEELKIYKAHLEQNFEFKKTRYSDSLIRVVKKLLSKDPRKRYNNSLQVLYDLDIPINKKISKDWGPARIFTNRQDVLNILDRYINDKSSSEIFSIKGFEGSGKTALSEEFNIIHDNSVLIKNDKSKSGYQYLKYFLKNIIFNEHIYSNISSETKSSVEKLIKSPSADLIDELKGIFSKVTRESDFILILDDFNSYDNFTFEMLKDVLPIFQVNKIKLVVTEDSDFDYMTKSFRNVKEINLTPFTDVQVSELIEKSYNNLFPKEDLKKLILLYADLLPGSIEDFVRVCLQLGIIQFGKDKTFIDVSEKTAKLLKSSHEQIYEVRLSYLSKESLEGAQVLSLFDLNLNEDFLAAVLEIDKNKTLRIIEELREKNILHSSSIGTKLQFTSEGLKKHIYSNIKYKKDYHLRAGRILKEKYADFDRNELARQFEMGEDYETCYQLIKIELNEAEKVQAYSYQKGILGSLLSLPIKDEQRNEVKYLLSEILFKLGDYKSSLNLTEELFKEKLSANKLNELTSMQGICLVETGEYQKGQQLLKSILKTVDNNKRDILLVSIAYSNFDLKNYTEAEEICTELNTKESSSAETKGKCYNLLGMIEIYKNNDINKALEYFTQALKNYQKDNLKRRVAGMEVNLGNIYNIKNEYAKAEEHWNSALQINSSIGNLEQEAKILLNYGVYYYNNLNYESSIEQYLRAYNIFDNLKIQTDLGYVLINLGEVYLSICDYQNGYTSLKSAREIFKKYNNSDLLGEVLFLLGKFYFLLGHEKKLSRVLEDYKALINDYNLSGKHKNYMEFLECMYINQNDKSETETDQIKKIRNIFLEQEDVNHFLKAHLFLIEWFVTIGNYEDALKEVDNQKFLDLSEKKLLIKAERTYLTGIISKYYGNFNGVTSVELFEKAFDQIKDENITELTWKILLELAEYYSKRGNYAKAKDYMNYSKAVINYIADKIEDIELHEIYLNSEQRIKALNKLGDLEKLQTI